MSSRLESLVLHVPRNRLSAPALVPTVHPHRDRRNGEERQDEDQEVHHDATVRRRRGQSCPIRSAAHRSVRSAEADNRIRGLTKPVDVTPMSQDCVTLSVSN